MDEALLKPSTTKPATLRQMLRESREQERILVAPGAFNAISAKIVEDCGFDLVYVSGAGLANGVGGYPDIGMMTLTEFSQQAGYIARAVNIPAIADADTGFGEAINVYRTVQEFERAGVCGIHIEDQIFPKRCGHLQGKSVISTDAMVEKIQAAVEARVNPDFLIIGRVDSKSSLGFDDAVARANRYLEAGADMIFPEALNTPEEFAEFSRQVPGLLLANMTEFGKTPYISVQDFQRFGYNIVIFPMTAFRIMMKAVRDGLTALKREGTQVGLLDSMTTRQELYDLIHYSAYESLDSVLTKSGQGSKL